jgi:hypothetical protein
VRERPRERVIARDVITTAREKERKRESERESQSVNRVGRRAHIKRIDSPANSYPSNSLGAIRGGWVGSYLSLYT